MQVSCFTRVLRGTSREGIVATKQALLNRISYILKLGVIKPVGIPEPELHL